MRSSALLTLAAVTLAAAACTDKVVAPLSPTAGPRADAVSARTGSVKPLPGEFSITSGTIAVSDIFGGSVTASSLAQSLAGVGVTVQNVSYTGTSRSAGSFANGTGLVGFNEGVILTSGWAVDASGPNSAPSTSRDLGTAGDAILTALSGFQTFDATILSFEIIPDADTVYFQYVFASEEYNEYVTTEFNDVFAFQINGQNCAVVGDPPVPVSINTINNGFNNSGVSPQNPGLYINNDGGALNLEPDGLTHVLTCKAPVNANVVNTVRLAIADASDHVWDSWVFIEKGSFTTIPKNRPPVLAPIADQVIAEGSTLSFTAVGSDPDAGQTLTYSLVSAPAGMTINASTGAVSWTPTDDNPTGTPSDVYTATVRVTDDFTTPASADQPVKITVNNVAPALSAFTTYPSGPVAVGTAVSLSAPYTDPGSGDTFSGTNDWGDGTTSAAVIAPFVSSSGSHTYSAPGVYTVTFSITDDDGGSGNQLFQYVVVYDPNAGFVTGGGWIDSPAGAYTADPALVGRANFGFISKYQKGASVPDGQTEFQFRTGSLNFHSTAYDWLVVSGPRAQYKGSGTINGTGDYGFLLSVIDGQVSGGGGVDRFRIKIWDKATSLVVYDNQTGAADTDPATTALGGGSIVIHSK